MTTIDIFKKYHPDWVKLGRNDKRVSKWINQHKNIDVIIDWYDDIDFGNTGETWEDVEGIGYGWIWCGVPDFLRYFGLWRIVCKNRIKKYFMDNIKDSYEVYCFYDDAGRKCIAEIRPYSICYLRMSNKELDPWE